MQLSKKDSQHNEPQPTDMYHNDTQPNNNKHIETQHDGIQQNDI
jgi:hypothetical protein